MHFLKTQLFQKAQLQKAEPNSPILMNVLTKLYHHIQLWTANSRLNNLESAYLLSAA